MNSLLFGLLALIQIVCIKRTNAKGLFPLNIKDAVQNINNMKLVHSTESLSNEFLHTSQRIHLQLSSFSSLITIEKTLNITHECSNQLQELEYALRKRELWALQGKAKSKTD
jgi:hypothetical protein